MSILEISLTNLFLWAFFSVIAGYFVHMYDKSKVSGGAVLTALFAIIGGVITGYLMSFMSGKGMLVFNMDALLVTTVGAAVFAFFYRFSFSRVD
jgi:uncharacterized membrane protein YeaQ/YmgE (transglycosylase-associated protein family)